MVEEGFGVVDTEMGVYGGPQIVGGEGPFDGIFTQSVGCADDLPGSHASAGHNQGHALGPVIPTGLRDFGLGSDGCVNFWGAAKLASDDEKGLFV